MLEKKKHYFYDCKMLWLREVKLYDQDKTTCKYCLERLWEYNIKRGCWHSNTENAKIAFKKHDEYYERKKELRKRINIT